jgi:ATP-dependent Clp protease protease subunit
MINGQSNHDWFGEFKNFAMNHMGVSGMQFHYWEQLQNTLYNNVNTTNVSGSLTPYVPEPNKLEVTMIDIFSRMMMDRTLWLAGPVNDQMSTVVQAQLLYLESLDPTSDIITYVDSPGGSVKSGLSIVDVMNYIGPDVQTICTGMAASMGSILLGNGAVGKRHILPHSKVMLHQVSHGSQGNVQDTRINQVEAEKYNDELFRLLGSYCKKDPKTVLADAERDLWLTGQEAVDYGICDHIIVRKEDI